MKPAKRELPPPQTSTPQENDTPDVGSRVARDRPGFKDEIARLLPRIDADLRMLPVLGLADGLVALGWPRYWNLVGRNPGFTHVRGMAGFGMKSLVLPIALLIAAPLAFAQTVPGNPGEERAETEEESNVTDREGPRNFWQASLPGGHYMVKLGSISSVSMHEYVLDGNLVVNEMTVDTNGRSLARFYHIRPVTDDADRSEVTRVVDRGRELLDRAGRRAGLAVHDMVQKNYPNTTHAGMVEFRILRLADLEEIYKSLRGAWERGRGRTVTIE